MKDINTNKLLKQILMILISFLLLIILLITNSMRAVLVPIFFSLFTALFLHPFIDRMHHTKVPNWLSTLIVYLIFLSIVSVFISIVIISFVNFLQDLPEITKEFRDRSVDIIKTILNLDIVQNYFKDQQEDYVNLAIDTVRQVISIDNFRYIIIKPVGIILSFLKGFGLYALALIFIIPGMDKIPIKILKAFPDEKGPRINEMITTIKESIQNYIVAKSIISLGVGFLSFIICIFFQVKYALLWGVIIFLFNYIPYIGSIIAVIFPVTLSLIQYQSFPHFIFLLIALTTVQVIMGNIVEPKFMSKGVNLSPLIIIISLLIWGYVWGIAGVILSVPIMSAFNIVCENVSSLKPINTLISAEKKKKKKNNKQK